MTNDERIQQLEQRMNRMEQRVEDMVVTVANFVHRGNTVLHFLNGVGEQLREQLGGGEEWRGDADPRTP